MSGHVRSEAGRKTDNNSARADGRKTDRNWGKWRTGGGRRGAGVGSLFFIDFDRLGWFLILGDRATIIDSKFFQIIDTKRGKLVFNQLQFL